MEERMKNIPMAEVLRLKELVAYQPGQVVSRTLAQNKAVSVTLFSFDKGEEMSLYEVVLRDLDGQLGIDRYDITWKDIFQYNDTFRFVQDKPLPAVHIYGDGNHTAVSDYLAEHIKPITVYGNPSQKDHSKEIKSF